MTRADDLLEVLVLVGAPEPLRREVAAAVAVAATDERIAVLDRAVAAVRTWASTRPGTLSAVAATNATTWAASCARRRAVR